VSEAIIEVDALLLGEKRRRRYGCRWHVTHQRKRGARTLGDRERLETFDATSFLLVHAHVADLAGATVATRCTHGGTATIATHLRILNLVLRLELLLVLDLIVGQERLRKRLETFDATSFLLVHAHVANLAGATVAARYTHGCIATIAAHLHILNLVHRLELLFVLDLIVGKERLRKHL